MIGSFLCVGLGLFAIMSVFFGWSDIPTIIILLIGYFVGIPLQFQKTLPANELQRLSEGKIVTVLGKRFWIPIGIGVVIAIAAAFIMKYYFELSIGSTILLTLGFAAILTAFVSPEFKTVNEPERFG